MIWQEFRIENVTVYFCFTFFFYSPAQSSEMIRKPNDISFQNGDGTRPTLPCRPQFHRFILYCWGVKKKTRNATVDDKIEKFAANAQTLIHFIMQYFLFYFFLFRPTPQHNRGI